MPKRKFRPGTQILRRFMGFYSLSVIVDHRHGIMIVNIQNIPMTDNTMMRLRLIILDFPNIAVAVDPMKHNVLNGPRMMKNNRTSLQRAQ